MRLYFMLPHHDQLSAILDKNPHFDCARQKNTSGEVVDVISCHIDDDKLNAQSVTDILPTLTLIRDALVADFVAAIKTKNLKSLLASTMQLRTFITYCNVLYKALAKINDKQLLDFVKINNINADYHIFPATIDDNQALLNSEQILWFTQEYENFSDLKYAEITNFQSASDADGTAFPASAASFVEVYQVMTEFYNLPEPMRISKASERIPFFKMKTALIQFLSETNSPSKQLQALTDLYELIKNVSMGEREDTAKTLLILCPPLTLTITVLRLNQEIIRFKTSFPQKAEQHSILTGDYISELKETLDFVEGMIPELERVDITNAACATPKIKQAIQENIDSLETLNQNLVTYQETSAQKASPRSAIVAENPSTPRRAITTEVPSVAVQGLHSPRVALAKNLIAKANDSTISVRQRVIDIHSELKPHKETLDSSGWNVLKGCWNALKRIGNAVKGVIYHRNDPDLRDAHLAKARDPAISVDKTVLSSRFFRAAPAVGVNFTNLTIPRRD